MRQTFRHILTAASALVVLATACTREHPYIPGDPGDGNGAVIPVTLSCEPLPTELDPSLLETKSTHLSSSLTKVTNANYYLFRSGMLVKQGYYDDIADFSVDIPSISYSYTLYVLANVGRVTATSGISETSFKSTLKYDYGTRAGYFNTISENGFPMANVITNFSVNSTAQFTLKRLVHTLYLKMNTEELSKSRMTFTGATVKQAPRDIFPFAASGSRATVTVDGDETSLSAEDIDALNAGEPVTLYVLENMRGDLIEGIDSWQDKVPSMISSTAERSLATYVEMTAQVVTPTATYENNVYRAYLGTGPENFDVVRNSYFVLNNKFTNDMVTDEDWRLEGDTPDITGTLCFADTRYTYDTAPAAYKDMTTDIQYRPYREVDYFYTMKGFTAMYYIYRSNPDIDYVLTVDKASSVEPYVSYETRKLDDYFTAIKISTTMPVSTSGYYGYSGVPSESSTKNVTFTIRSTDGLLEDTMTVRVLYKRLGVYFHYDGAAKAVATTDDGKLNMYMCNPMNLNVTVRITGTLNGYVSYKPNGTVFGSKSQSPEVHISTGGGYSVSSGAVRMDTWQDNTNYGGTVIYDRDGFYEYFKQIWNTTGWDSYTALNGSNGYHKHAHPTKLQLSFTFKFDSPNGWRLKPDNGLRLPVYWCNNEYCTNSEGTGYGAGTDWGFEWDHFDKEGSSSYDRYRFLKHVNTPSVSIFTYDYMVPIGIKFNSTEKWRTESLGIPLAVTYGDGWWSELGF